MKDGHFLLDRPIRAIILALCIFGLSGAFGLFIDFDHVLRCIPNISWQCISDEGTKTFHTWIGALYGVSFGLVCTYLVGCCTTLVDDTTSTTS